LILGCDAFPEYSGSTEESLVEIQEQVESLPDQAFKLKAARTVPD
jgi:hypothetical protein